MMCHLKSTSIFDFFAIVRITFIKRCSWYYICSILRHKQFILNSVILLTIHFIKSRSIPKYFSEIPENKLSYKFILSRLIFIFIFKGPKFYIGLWLKSKLNFTVKNIDLILFSILHVPHWFSKTHFYALLF